MAEDDALGSGRNTSSCSDESASELTVRLNSDQDEAAGSFQQRTRTCSGSVLFLAAPRLATASDTPEGNLWRMAANQTGGVANEDERRALVSKEMAHAEDCSKNSIRRISIMCSMCLRGKVLHS